MGAQTGLAGETLGSSPHPRCFAAPSQSDATAPSPLWMDFPSGWIFPSSGVGLCRGESSCRQGIAPEMSREDLYRSAASPGADCAMGRWITAPGENNPLSPAFSFPFYFPNSWWIPEGWELWGGGGSSSDVRCPPCRER